MTYWQFLIQWYNAVFLVLGMAGVGLAVVARSKGRTLLVPAAALVVAAVVGLTWNGAIHDLALGSPGPRFLYVFPASLVAGWVVARVVARFRARYLRPIEAVRFNRPGYEGTEARLVTRTTGPQPGSGRAQWQDEEGALHIVHVHTRADTMGFGLRVRLESFDPVTESYLVTPLPRGRKARRGRDVSAPV